MTGWKFGTVEVTKEGRRWLARVRSPSNGSMIDQGYLDFASPEDAKKWAENRWQELEFVTKLQQAMDAGKITPTEYYQIWERFREKRSGCQRNHTHSLQCRYHSH